MLRARINGTMSICCQLGVEKLTSMKIIIFQEYRFRQLSLKNGRYKR